MSMFRSVEQSETALEPEYRMPTGVSIAEMARSARDVFLGVVLQGKFPAWNSLRTEQQERWIYVAGLVARTLLSEEEVAWAAVTKACHKVFHSADTWANEPEPVRIAWEGAVRHMANIGWTSADEDSGEKDDALTGEEIAQLETQAKEWVVKRLLQTI